jgi:hypothetical protein
MTFVMRTMLVRYPYNLDFHIEYLINESNKNTNKNIKNLINYECI